MCEQSLCKVLIYRNENYLSYRLHKPDPPMHIGRKKCLSSKPVKMRKYLSNVHKMGGAHLQCINNY